MKRFRFPLRPVAIVRAHHEMRAREAFGVAVHAYVKAEQELTAAKERVRTLAEGLVAGRARNFSAADEINVLMAYRHECSAQEEAEKAVVAARQSMNERRMEYLDAHRKVEVVKRLEEKARATHQYETMREEQAAFDDFSGRQFSRRSVNST